ncbi:hypothetical protein [Dysgonomonas reticulitermitis]
MNHRKALTYLILPLFLFLPFYQLSCSDKSSTESIVPVPDPEQESAMPEPFRANRILIKHGLQIQCWVATENLELGQKTEQPAYKMLSSDWAQTGFTAPTFFGPPLFNPSFFKDLPNSQWSIAKAPHADQLKKAPTDNEKKVGFLTSEQKKYLGTLVSVCFGDEEHYSGEIVNYLKEWYGVARKHYPDVLIHNNQYPGQWTENELRDYVKDAKPDLLTYDWYYFDHKKPLDYKGAKDMANHLMMYRNLALEGTGGIAFGQYIQGFAIDGVYKLTESQLRLYYYLTWTMGGKWLNWFRYLQGNEIDGQTHPTDWALLLQRGMPGNSTKYMQWTNKCNEESKFISDYLVRLKTRDVRYVSGDNSYKEGKPSRLGDFLPNKMFLNSIGAELVAEPGKSADLYVGFYDIIPEEEKGDPGFFTHLDVQCFMVTNALTSPNHELAETLTQKVNFSINMSDIVTKKLYYINQESGLKEVLSPAKAENNINTYVKELKGGSGCLFILE